MADKVVTYNAVDVLSLGANFGAVSNGDTEQHEVIDRLKSDGELHSKVRFNQIDSKPVTYEYLGSDLAADLTAKLGQVVNSEKVTGITLTFRHKQAIQIAIECHNHPTNAHAAGTTGEFDGYGLELSTLIGAGVAYGMPTGGKPWANSNTNASQIGLTLRYSCQHDEREGDTGEHFTSHDSNGQVEATAEFLGNPTLTTTGWTIATDDDQKSRQNAQGVTVTGSKGLTRTVVP